MGSLITVVWLQFLVCMGLVGYAGTRLSRYGDAIADKTGLGGSWIGLILLATVTSLPELAVGLSAVTAAHAPEIAVGNVFGACVLNLLIVVVLDFINQGGSVFGRTSQGHILSAGFGVVLIGFAGLNLLLAHTGGAGVLESPGVYSLVILLLYGVAVRTLYRYETGQVAAITEKEPDRYPNLSLGGAMVRYGMAAALVVATGTWLPFVAETLATRMGWGQGFVGTVFVPMVTSMPELVVAVMALRLGAVDMAVSGLLGSNLFNIVILAVDDLAYAPGRLFFDVSASHGVSALSAVMMTGIAIIGLFYRPKTLLFRTVGWASLGLFTVYVLNMYVHFLYER